MPPHPHASLLTEILRFAVAPGLALGAAAVVDRMCAARGVFPPGFARPWRRALAFLTLAFFLWIGLFATLAGYGREAPADLTHLDWPRLFLLHGLMVVTILVWFLAGYAGISLVPPSASREEELREELSEVLDFSSMPELPTPPPPSFLRTLASQLGFLTPSLPQELGVGVLVGVGSWFAAIFVALLLALLLYALGGEALAPKEPPEMILWIAALPIGVRFLAALSAGVVEETFFRGFLQPRIGIALSSACFVLGHLSYGQPFLLVGITVLSLIYAYLVRLRQTVWPAIAAHALFDGVQLLVVIPTTLKFLGKG
ncbi:MAG TPA: CPBP family intramembrane glutamic endopeptidase [Thermoanaerobaculia bacterium]|nr:CPBP family intramembrane glutamic endopeptidase [Thermoanaerobaculia bacterium]